MTAGIDLLGLQVYSGIMSLEAEDPQDELGGDEVETSKRSERKRQREKQRRSDLSNAFDELAAFIVQVEPEAGESDSDAKKKRKKNEGGEDSSGITRLDLIGRALRIMKRLHRENEERKRIIGTLQERGSGSHASDNVLVMVPSLTPVSEEQYSVARASYPTYAPHHPSYYQGSQVPSVSQQPPPPEYAMQLPGGRPHYPPSTWGSYGRPSHQQLPYSLGAPSAQHRMQHPRSPTGDGSSLHPSGGSERRL